MQTAQIKDVNEEIYADFKEIFNDINSQITDERKKLNEHIREAVNELAERNERGQKVTIVQKNVLLNLLNSLHQLNETEKKVEFYKFLTDSILETKINNYENDNETL